jgi:hypothetical protein
LFINRIRFTITANDHDEVRAIVFRKLDRQMIKDLKNEGMHFSPTRERHAGTVDQQNYYR